MKLTFGGWVWRVRVDSETRRVRYSLFGVITLGNWSVDECELLPFRGEGLRIRKPGSGEVRLRGLGIDDGAELHKLLAVMKWSGENQLYGGQTA